MQQTPEVFMCINKRNNTYFSTVTGQKARDCSIICAEKVRTESLSFDSLMFANTEDF